VLQARVKSALLLRRAASLVLAAVLLAGCDKLFDQKGDDALNMAREKEKEGDYQGAIQSYEASLDGTEKTAESHYSMALIFDDKLENPVAALDHFRRYIELSPNGAHVKDAKSFAAQDQFKLVNTLSNGSFMPQQDAARLKNQNFQLQQQLDDVRKQIADMRAAVAAARVIPGRGAHSPEPEQKPIPPDARVYRVEPGDTLSSISRKFFNNPNRWQDIQDANFSRLAGSVKLKVGMNLVIPKE
jgi:tetratricopeptide (TPR) repeat protein